MLRRAPFIQKLLNRLERVERESIQSYLVDLAHENAVYMETLDHLNEGVLLVTSQGKLILANRQASLWLGLDPSKKNRHSVTSLIQDTELSHFIENRLKGLKERLVGDLRLLVPREMNLRVLLMPLAGESAAGEILILLSNIGGEKSE